VLKRLEEDTDRFSKSLDSALDRSVLNGTQAEDEINGYVHQFEEATDRLKDRYEDQGGAERCPFLASVLQVDRRLKHLIENRKTQPLLSDQRSGIPHEPDH
jgi:hypothetical protein